MAVYATKSMLTAINKLQLPSTTMFPDEGSVLQDHWRKLMDSTSTIRLSKAMICRVCGKSGCTPISEKIYGYEIIGIIQSVTNVTMDIDDSLPKYICTDCLEMLKIALTFRRTCETSDRKFKKILNPNGDPLFYSYPYSKHDFQLILHQMKTKRAQREEQKLKERLKRERERERKAPKVKQFKCSPCDIIFPNKEALTTHRRERQCMRRACDICGQLVVSISQHMRHIHKQTVPHKCPTCGKEFPIIARLKTHMMVHTNTFNFFCDLCPYKSKHKYYLVMHMRTHTGEKPYKCTECPATFVNPSNMNKHKLTHQEKQFKCHLCDKAFRTTSGLREHDEAAHMNIKHTCQMCGRDFCYKTDLRKHEIRHHNRIKRDYVGGEPSYKQVERLQKHTEMDRMQKLPGVETMEQIDKWRTDDMPVVTDPPTVLQITYMDPSKDYMQANMQQNNLVYFSDVQMMQQQPHLVPQQTVQLSLPELTMKKDEVKMYEPQQNIGYF